MGSGLSLEWKKVAGVDLPTESVARKVATGIKTSFALK